MAALGKTALVLVSLATAAVGQQQSQKTPLDEFQERVAGYLKLRKAVTDQLPKVKPTPSAQRLAEQKMQLASSIVRVRGDATQGMIFTPEIAGEFRKLLKLAMSGNNGARVRKSLKRAEPATVAAVRVNEAVPLPLQSMPATLLMSLPKLPMELEYRLVGRALVLRDAQANLVVDFVTEAIP